MILKKKTQNPPGKGLFEGERLRMCLSEMLTQQWVRSLDLHGFLPPVMVFHDVYGPTHDVYGSNPYSKQTLNPPINFAKPLTG